MIIERCRPSRWLSRKADSGTEKIMEDAGDQPSTELLVQDGIVRGTTTITATSEKTALYLFESCL